MTFKIDNNFNKIITVECDLAENFAEKYKYLHQKNLKFLDDTEDLHDILIGEIDGDTHLVIVFKDLLKPNLAFKFSQKLDTDRLQEDIEYLSRCQFFYWVDDDGISHIRFARPYLDFNKITSVIFK